MGQGTRLTPEQAFYESQRAIIERLDAIIALLSRESKLPVDEILMSLISVGLPAAPKTTSLVPVTTSPTILAENQSLSIMRVEITNDDVAQQIYLDCNPDVLLTNGRRLNAQQTIAYTINRGQTLYGVCTVGTVNTRVAYSQSPLSALKEGPIVV